MIREETIMLGTINSEILFLQQEDRQFLCPSFLLRRAHGVQVLRSVRMAQAQFLPRAERTQRHSVGEAYRLAQFHQALCQ